MLDKEVLWLVGASALMAVYILFVFERAERAETELGKWVKEYPFQVNKIPALEKELYELKIKLDQEKYSHQNSFNHWHIHMDAHHKWRKMCEEMRNALETISVDAANGEWSNAHYEAVEALKKYHAMLGDKPEGE